MEISAASIKQLREATGAGVLDCRKALEACGLERGEYLTALDPESPLPWDVIDTGLGKDHLRSTACARDNEWRVADHEYPGTQDLQNRTHSLI
mgnify:CR=1 FL=1